MSDEQVIDMLIKRVEKMQDKLDTHDNRITQILVSIGKAQVKNAMITGVFGTVGGALTVIILKYLFNAF